MEPTLNERRSSRKGRCARRRATTLDWGRATQQDLWHIPEQLKELAVEDHRHCELSKAPTTDAIWVFTPELWGDDLLWIRLIERNGIVVVSFHRA